MNYHSGLRYQRGGFGFGSILSGLFRTLRPLASMGLSAGKKFIASDFAKKLGSTALDIGKNSVTNVVTGLLEGVPFRQTAEQELEDAKSKIAQVIKGGGKKRKRKTNKNKSSCKKISYSLID